MAVYFAMLQPGDTVLGMNLAHGGHLTHGHPLNFSGKLLQRRALRRRPRDRAHRLRRRSNSWPCEHKPKMIIAGASAYPRIIDFAALPRDRRQGRAPCSSWTWRTSPAWSPPACTRRPVPHCRFRHHHHAQDPARTARRHGPVQRRVRQGDRPRRLPRHPGRPADARHRGQGGGVQGSARSRRSRPTSSRSSKNAKRLAAAPHRPGLPRSSPAAPTTT